MDQPRIPAARPPPEDVLAAARRQFRPKGGGVMRAKYRWLVLAIVAIGGLTAGAGTADAQVPSTTYTIHTFVGAGTDRWVDATVGVPTPVDYHGDGVPDVLFHLLPVPGAGPVPASARLSVVSLYPLRAAFAFEVVARLPNGDYATFGNDGLTGGCGSPRAFTANIRYSTGEVTVEHASIDPGPCLTVTGGLFSGNPRGIRSAYKAGRVKLSPVPASGHMTVQPPFGNATLVVGLGASSRVRADIEASDDLNASTRNFVTATVTGLPTGMRVDVVGLPDPRVISYGAFEAPDSIAFSAKKYVGGALAKEIFGRLVGVRATQISVTRHTATHAVFTTNAPIDQAEFGMADGGLVETLHVNQPLPDYLYRVERAGYSSTAARVRNVRSVDVQTGSTIRVNASHAGGVFHIVANGGGDFGNRTVDAWVRDVPGTVDLTYDRANGSIAYLGSAPIGEITVDARDPNGLFPAGDDGRTGFERAQRLTLTARGIPANVTLSLAPGGGGLDVYANGQTIGSIEVFLTNGFLLGLPASTDGFIMRDLPDPGPAGGGFGAFGRVTGLRRITFATFRTCAGEGTLLVSCDSGMDATIDTTGSRPFTVDLENQKTPTSKLEYTRATIDALVPGVRVSMRESAVRQFFFGWRTVVQRTQMAYWTTPALASSGGLSFDTNMGQRDRMFGSLSTLPASLSVCQATDGFCTASAAPANKGTLAFSASSHTTLNLDDCQIPTGTGGCSEFTLIDDLNVRTVVTESHDFGDGRARTLIDTDSQVINGFAGTRKADGSYFKATLGAGTVAQDFEVVYRSTGIDSKTGTLVCGPGTKFEIPVFGFNFDITWMVC